MMPNLSTKKTTIEAAQSSAQIAKAAWGISQFLLKKIAQKLFYFNNIARPGIQLDFTQRIKKIEHYKNKY